MREKFSCFSLNYLFPTSHQPIFSNKRGWGRNVLMGYFIWVYPGLAPGNSVLEAIRIITGNFLSFSQFTEVRKEKHFCFILFSPGQFFLPLILNFLAKSYRIINILKNIFKLYNFKTPDSPKCTFSNLLSYSNFTFECQQLSTVSLTFHYLCSKF